MMAPSHKPAWIDVLEEDGTCALVVPRTPTGRAKKYGTWELALADILTGSAFPRSTDGTDATSKHGARFTAVGERAKDFAELYPEAARALLVGLVEAVYRECKVMDTRDHADALLESFDAWMASPNVDPWDTGTFADIESVEWAMAELGMSRSGVKKAVREGRIAGKKLSDRVYVVSKASVQEKGVRK